jgi:hypothetical protein
MVQRSSLPLVINFKLRKKAANSGGLRITSLCAGYPATCSICSALISKFEYTF